MKINDSKWLYHITRDIKTYLKIMETGLKAGSDNHIYLITNKQVIPYVALNQLGLENYIVIKVNTKGIIQPLKPDLVGEITAKFQVRVNFWYQLFRWSSSIPNQLQYYCLLPSDKVFLKACSS